MILSVVVFISNELRTIGLLQISLQWGHPRMR